MKKFDKLSYDEKAEVVSWFSNWLKNYTHEVIIKVLERKDEILANDFAMNLMKELFERETKENKDFSYSIDSLMNHFETFKEYNPHNHPVTHSDSYRNVLYDMYIR